MTSPPRLPADRAAKLASGRRRANDPRRRCGLFATALGLGLLSGGLLLATSLRAADDEDGKKLQQQRFIVPDDQVIRKLLGNKNPSDVRLQFEAQLQMRIDDLSRNCTVTDEQRRKFTVAGQGDVKRFFDDFDEAREAFRHTQTLDDCRAMMERCQPAFASRVTRLYHDDSLLEKMIRKSLTPEQRQQAQAARDERRLFRYRAHVEAVVALWDGNLALTSDQRKRLVALLLEDTQPPPEGAKEGAFSVWLQAADLPDTAYLAILDQPQWRLLQQQFKHVKEMEPVLKAGIPRAGAGLF